MKKKYLLYSLAGLFILGSLAYFTLYYSPIDAKDEKIYTFLLRVEDSANNTKLANILFYSYPKNFLFLFRLSKKAHVRSPNNYGLQQQQQQQQQSATLENLFQLKPRSLRNTLENLYDIDIDYTITIHEEKIPKLLSSFGGTPFFNLYSNKLRHGEVFINGNNYRLLLDGIEDERHRLDTAISVWYALLSREVKKYHGENINLLSLYKFLRATSGNLRFAALRRFLKPLIEEGQGRFYFQSQVMNLEYSATSTAKPPTHTPNAEQKIYFPFQDGQYDTKKIKSQLKGFLEEQSFYRRFPISLQINNTTDIKRIAAKTAGVFRIKRINVNEYLNSSIVLQQSTLVNFAHSPVKTEYMKKVAKVENIYPLVHYRHDFDFALYIAKDFYGIALLENQINK